MKKTKKKIFTNKDAIANLLANSKSIDMNEVLENMRLVEEERKREEAEKRQMEQERINALACPVCKSTNKRHHTRYKSNGVIGPGHHSTKIEDYYICLDCGIHFSDIKKPSK